VIHQIWFIFANGLARRASRCIGIDLHSEKVSKEKAVVVDTTVQEKNITYPTDTKLACKIAEQCVGIACQEEIKLRRSYARTIPKLVFAQRGRHHPRGMKRAGQGNTATENHCRPSGTGVKPETVCDTDRGVPGTVGTISKSLGSKARRRK
jgi:hypothetical protein